MEKTIGEIRVRTLFNPSANGEVDLIKQKSAELINLVNEHSDNLIRKQRDAHPGLGPQVLLAICEINRSSDYSMRLIETACMFAVKAVTTEIPQ